jgi:hypothetical protein
VVPTVFILKSENNVLISGTSFIDMYNTPQKLDRGQRWMICRAGDRKRGKAA